jgi:hypothetical protein
MPRADHDLVVLQTIARQNERLNWYVIADSAQHSALPMVLENGVNKACCLFGAVQNSPLAKCSPHLVELGTPLEMSSAWRWIQRNANLKPCISVMATEIGFQEMLHRLSSWTEIGMPDGDSMYFAFWDPAILGPLLGQSDDQTLHVKGPILSHQQTMQLVQGLEGWWYWDRLGKMHAIRMNSTGECQEEPVILSQQQVDDLVEASVPDHILYYLKLNHPLLLTDIRSCDQYKTVQKALSRAREIGLFLMSDMVNFVCIDLIYRERIQQDPVLVNLLEQVRHGRVSFRNALDRMP